MSFKVHSSFCSERGEVKGRKITIGAEVAEDWNFLTIYNGLVVGVGEKAKELVLQTKTGDPHQLWKFKDGLLMNKIGLVAECKPRGFPKWWQVKIFLDAILILKRISFGRMTMTYHSYHQISHEFLI